MDGTGVLRTIGAGALVGRSAALGALSGLASGVADGNGVAACITGPAGIGKSALVRGLITSIGWTTVVGRCAPAPAAPLRCLTESAITALTCGATPDVVDKTVFGPAMRTLLAGASDASDAGRQPIMLGEAMLRLLDTIPEDPVLWVVEDLHWADAESVAALDYAVDHLTGRRLLLVMTARAQESPAVTKTLDRWQERRGATMLPVPPLSPPKVRDLIAGMINGSPPSTFVDAVVAASDGYPLLVEEHTREALTMGALIESNGTWSIDETHELAVPAPYQHTVERRVRAMRPAPRDAIRLAAIVGRDLDPVLLRRLGVPRDVAANLPAAAITSQLAVRAQSTAATVRFRHALTRDAVAATLSTAERAVMAAAALAAFELDALDDADLEVAAELAAVAGDKSRACSLLLDGARRAVRKGATGAALDRLDAAQALGDVTTTRDTEMRELRVQAAALAGRAAEAVEIGAQLLADLRRAGEADGVHRVTLALARSDGALNDWTAAARRLDDVLLELPEYDRPADLVSFRAIVAIELGDVVTAERLAQATLQRAREPGILRCEAHEVLGRVAREHSYVAAAEHFRDGVHAAEEAGLPFWRARSLLELGVGEGTLYGRVDTFEAAHRSAVACGALSLDTMALYNLANMHAFAFRGHEAITSAMTLIETAHSLGAAKMEALGWIVAGEGHAMLGQRGKARLAADHARRVAPDDVEVDGMATGMCEGMADLLLGDVNAAVDAYGRAIKALLQMPVPTATASWYVGPLVLTVADHPLAEAAREQLQVPGFAAAPSLERELHLVEAVLAGAAGDDAALRAALEAERHHVAEHPELYENCALLWHTLWTVTAIAALRDGWGTPIDEIRAAKSAFTAADMNHAERWCARLLRDAGVTPRRRGRGHADVPDELAHFGVTAREHDVLQLLAERLTNKEIAERLVVSASTVKTHVERLLQKTGRRNRVELAELATELEAGP